MSPWKSTCCANRLILSNYFFTYRRVPATYAVAMWIMGRIFHRPPKIKKSYHLKPKTALKNNTIWFHVQSFQLEMGKYAMSLVRPGFKHNGRTKELFRRKYLAQGFELTSSWTLVSHHIRRIMELFSRRKEMKAVSALAVSWSVYDKPPKIMRHMHGNIPTCWSAAPMVHPHFHWLNSFATILSKFYWQKFDRNCYN